LSCAVGNKNRLFLLTFCYVSGYVELFSSLVLIERILTLRATKVERMFPAPTPTVWKNESSTRCVDRNKRS